MKKSLLVILLLAALLQLSAQITRYYDFAYSTETYSSFGGYVLGGLSADDVLSEPIDLGFTFPYCNQEVTTVKISTNGFINPGSNWTYPSANNQLNYGIYPVIAPLWDNLSMQSGDVWYRYDGEAPNRYFTVQYNNARWPYNGGTNRCDFQVSLYETGLIKFIYGDSFGDTSAGSASIGINMSPAGNGYFWSVTPGNPPTAVTSGENYNINTFPSSGTVYSFVPRPAIINDLRVTGISCNPHYYLDAGEAFNVNVTVRNVATQPVEDFDVVLYNGNSEIGRQNVSTLLPNQEVIYYFEASIDSCGLKTITATAESAGDEFPGDNSKCIYCIVRPEAETGIVFGAGNELLRIPLDLYWKFSLYETLYYPAEIGQTGLIYGVSFFNHYTMAHNPYMRFWIGETTQPDLGSGWISANELNLVWDMGIELPAGENELYIPFSQPYHYHGQNLVIMAYQSHTNYCGGDDYCEAQTLTGERALKRYSDAYDPDPYNPPANITANGQVPKIAFYMIPTVESVDELIPSAEDCFGNHPNPFSGQTTFSFSATKAPTFIDIYNLKGQKVRSLLGHSPAWDGCDETGKQLPAGIYLAKMTQGSRILIKKMCKM